MFRALIPLLALACPALADPAVDYRHEEAPDGTIRIVVPLEDLFECQVTLAMVLTPWTADEDGNPAPAQVSDAPGLPAAVCVTDEG